MDINRNQFFMAGLVVLFLGLQFRAIDSIVLTPKCTRVLAQYSGQKTPAAAESAPQINSMTVRPPEWVGWSLLSLGSVFVLHSLAMKKPGT